jgi:hypothetical protein
VVDVVVVVVVVVVGGTVCPPQLVSVTTVPEYHLPLRRTSAWNLQAWVGGTSTVRVPWVPESVPTRLPDAHRFRIQTAPRELVDRIVKLATLDVIVGGCPWANAHGALPTATRKTTPMPIPSRFILLLLV